MLAVILTLSTELSQLWEEVLYLTARSFGLVVVTLPATRGSRMVTAGFSTTTTCTAGYLSFLSRSIFLNINLVRDLRVAHYEIKIQ